MKIYGLLSLVFLVACATTSSSKLSDLNNKSPLRVSIDKSLPRQFVSIVFTGLPEAVPSSKQSIFSVVSRILEKGPAGMSEKEYRQWLFLRNADISFATRYRAFSLSIIAPPQYMAEVLHLAIKTMQEPKFKRSVIRNALIEAKANAKSEFSRMSTVIQYYAFKDYFDYADFTNNGTASPSMLQDMKWQEVEPTYRKYFSFQHLRYYAAGPMAKTDMANMLENQKALVDTKYQEFQFAEKSLTKKDTKVKIIHRPGVTDHQVLLVFPFHYIPASREGLKADLMFEVFGGGITGQLGKVLREKRGLTYHVSASSGSNLPVWYVYSFAGDKQIKDLLKGIMEVKNKFATEGPNKTDLHLAKQALITSYKASNELPFDRLVQELYYDLYSYDFSYYYKYEDKLKSISLAEVKAFSKEVLNSNGYTLYLMGDKKVLLPVVKTLGFDKNIDVISETSF